MVLRPGEEDTGRLVVENGIALKCFRFQLDNGRTDMVETNNDKLTSSILLWGMDEYIRSVYLEWPPWAFKLQVFHER